MSVTFSGSLDITGSLFVNGGEVVSGFNPMTNLYDLINDRNNIVQTLNANAGGLFNLHISESGLHKIDAINIGAVSASVNVIFYPDSFTTSGSQATYWFTLNSGSGVGMQIRTLISSSTSTYYTPSLTIGGANFNTSKQSTAVNYTIAQGSGGNPSIFTVQSDGTKIFGNGQNPVGGANNIEGTGNKGTAIV
jgi:hypothetical protein